MKKLSLKEILSKILCVSMVAVFFVLAAGSGNKASKSESVAAVESLILCIGEVNLDSETAISEAETAYSELSDKEKKSVENYDVLQSAREEYDALVAEENNKRIEAVSEVEELITQITSVDLANADKIYAAKDAYDDLPEEYKADVENASDLETMVEQVEQLQKENVAILLSNMRKNEDRVRNMSFYYPSAWKFYSDGWVADERCFVLPYVGSQDGDYWFRLVFNYTGDDWVFFDEIIVAADDKRFDKAFSYSEVNRDNANGDVWEYVDINVTDDDIEILRAIVNSNETIIRFQGDQHRHDFTVNESDKRSIQAVLDVYDALN